MPTEQPTPARPETVAHPSNEGRSAASPASSHGRGPAANQDTRPPQGERKAALQLLLRAALPEIALLKGALVWLVLAAALEALGPLLGKAFIDRYLLPRDANVPVRCSASANRSTATCCGCRCASSTAPSPASSSAASPTTPRR
jgi:hypothetical protein